MVAIKVHSINKYDEIEWTQVFESNTARGARNKATRWLNKESFPNTKIVKDEREWFLLENKHAEESVL